MNLKSHIGEFWSEYKAAMGLFVMGKQAAEDSRRPDQKH